MPLNKMDVWPYTGSCAPSVAIFKTSLLHGGLPGNRTQEHTIYGQTQSLSWQSSMHPHLEFKVAAKNVQQFKQHSDFNLMATAYLTCLTSYMTAPDSLPAEFGMNNLVNMLATNKGQLIPIIPHPPAIHHFGKGSRNLRNSKSSSNQNGNRK